MDQLGQVHFKGTRVMGDKKEQAFTVSGNTLKLESRPADAIADTSSDILLNYAFDKEVIGNGPSKPSRFHSHANMDRQNYEDEGGCAPGWIPENLH